MIPLKDANDQHAAVSLASLEAIPKDLSPASIRLDADGLKDPLVMADEETSSSSEESENEASDSIAGSGNDSLDGREDTDLQSDLDANDNDRQARAFEFTI